MSSSGSQIATEFHRIGSDAPPYLIAEIGLNHNGDPELALKTVAAAAAAGCSAVKFQMYDASSFIDPSAELGEEGPGSLREFFRSFELAPDAWRTLAERSRELGVDFFCSIFDRPSLDFYRTLAPRLVKISSCDITNRPLLDAVCETGLPVLLSTGTAEEEEVRRAVEWLGGKTKSPLVLLQCVSAYPSPPADYNLPVLAGWRERYGTLVGISDHCQGNGVSLAALALGACVVERHFTLDRRLPGPDHALSLEPDEFRRLSEEAAAGREALKGDGVRRPTEAEDGARRFGRRSLYLSRDVVAGRTVAEGDLIPLRPGGGVGPEAYAELLGRTWARDVRAGARLSPEMTRG